MDWQTLRNQFMRNIGGDPPGSQLEDELIHAYTNHPEAVERSFEKITLAHKAGKIRSPWGALKAEVAKAVDTARNPSHQAGTKRSSAVQRAEQWIRTAGLHMPWTEVENELFGDPETTPPAEWLIELERETRDQPGRPIYDSLLKAAIVRTMNDGPQPVPASEGTLKRYDTPEIRQRIRDLWDELRPAGIIIEQQADKRGERNAETIALLAAAAPTETPDQRLERQKQLAATKAQEPTT